MDKLKLKELVDTLKDNQEVLEKRLGDLVDERELSYADIEEVCADIDYLYGIDPTFTVRDKVRVENEMLMRMGLEPTAVAL